ncbi:MAG: LamG domain-containing protein [Rhodoferax sp.]|nr:LamG domain-containing protein [Rhodoferax sp.]
MSKIVRYFTRKLGANFVGDSLDYAGIGDTPDGTDPVDQDGGFVDAQVLWSDALSAPNISVPPFTTPPLATPPLSALAFSATAADSLAVVGTSSFLPDRVVQAAPTDAPLITLGEGVSGLANLAETVASSGVVLVSGAAGAQVRVTFTDSSYSGHSLVKTVTGMGGTPVPVVLTAEDLAIFGSAKVDWNFETAKSTYRYTATLNPGESNWSVEYDVGPYHVEKFKTYLTGSVPKLRFEAVTNGWASTSTVFSWTAVPNSAPVAITVTATVVDAAGKRSTAASASFTLDTFTPTPGLSLGAGVSNGANLAEATASSGVLVLTAELGSSVLITFTDSATPTAHRLVKTVIGSGQAQAILLANSDLGQGANQLQDGPITVSASATDAAGNVSGVGSSSFELDATVPTLSAQEDGTPALSVMGKLLTLHFNKMLDSSTVPLFNDPRAVLVTYTPLGGVPTNNTIQTLSLWGKQLRFFLSDAIPYGALVTFRYTDTSSADQPTSVIQDQAGNDVASFTQTVANLSTLRPTVVSVAFSDAEGNSYTSKPGAVVAATLRFSENVIVNGPVSFVFQIGNGPVFGGTYTPPAASGSERTSISFSITLPDAPVGANSHIRLIGIDRDASNIRGAFTRQQLLPSDFSSPLTDNSYWVDSTPPTVPVIALGAGIADGASRAEATATTGVLTVRAEAGSTVLVSLRDSANHTVTKTVLGTGFAQPVTLSPLDLAGQDEDSKQLQDGPISVTALAQDGAGNSSRAAHRSFSLQARPPTLVLTLSTDVAEGATAAEATDSSGVLTVSGDAGDRITLTFSDSATPTAHRIVRTLIGSGSDQAITLTADELGSGATQLGDGLISISASSSSANGNSNSTVTTLVLDTQVPLALAGKPTIRFSADTGMDGDFITSTHVQTITVGLNAGLAANDVLWGSLDDGTSWTQLNRFVRGRTLTWVGANLLAGSHTLKLQVKDLAGNAGAVFQQDYVTGAVGPSLALGKGVADGANRAEFSAATGVLTVSADAGSSALLTFTDTLNHTLVKTLVATGAAQPVVLSDTDIGTRVGQLSNGLITVNAQAWPVNGVASDASGIHFHLYADMLALGSGVADGATAAELVQDSGVLTLFAAAGSRVLVTFSDSATPSAHQLVKTLLGNGASQAITLAASDLGGGAGAGKWMDGNISVHAVAYDANNQPNNTGSIRFRLDTLAPTTVVDRETGLNLNHQYASLPSVAGLGGDLTLEAWVYARGTQGNGARILDLASASNASGVAHDNLVLGFNGSSGNLVFLAYNGSNGAYLGVVTAPTALPTDSWHHVAVTVDSQRTVSLYVDGVLVTTGVLTADIPTVARSSNFVGHSTFPGVADFNGVIRDVRIHNDSHTAAEINRDMRDGYDVFDSNWIGFYPLYANANSPFGGTATLVGGPVFPLTSVHLSADSGAVGDFVTHTASQTITAQLTAALAADETLRYRLDSGHTWTEVNSTAIHGSSVTLAGITLLAGTHNLEFQVKDAAGNVGRTTAQPYTLDTTPPTAFVPGEKGLKLQSASHQYAQLANNTTTFIADLTLEAWVYADGSQKEWARILDLGNGERDSNVVLGISGGHIGYSIYNGSTDLGTKLASTPFGIHGWHHVALAVDIASRPTATLYVDGEIAVTGTLSAPIAYLDRLHPFVGHSNWPNDDADFNGVIRDVRIYDTYRTQTDIKGDMAGAVNASDGFLLGYYPFNTSAASGKPNGASATLTGAPNTTNPALVFSNDTGTLGDYKTSTRSQTITARLSGNLAAGESLWGTVNGDAATPLWVNLDGFTNGNTVSWTDVTLGTIGEHPNGLQLQVHDLAGNTGTLLMQSYTVL